jgi:HPt (histidine-containing phosphotransfer) domain-containing protein
MSKRSSPAGVNLPELLERVDNDRDLLCELIGIFKEDFPRLLEALRRSVADEDLKAVEAKSHALKGMLLGLSVTQAAAIAARVEQMGREGRTLGLAETLALLESEVADLLRELDGIAAESEP